MIMTMMRMSIASAKVMASFISPMTIATVIANLTKQRVLVLCFCGAPAVGCLFVLFVGLTVPDCCYVLFLHRVCCLGGTDLFFTVCVWVGGPGVFLRVVLCGCRYLGTRRWLCCVCFSCVLCKPSGSGVMFVCVLTYRLVFDAASVFGVVFYVAVYFFVCAVFESRSGLFSSCFDCSVFVL